ncbi:MAG: metallophosphoesterase family protein [Dysgonomonas sp.]|nr:metallophosphoesterase family protein [Dysgonomonas sp.]
MENPKIWFTSDTHFGHKNIIKFSERPFVDVDEMNETMIQRWNEVVGENDIVYHLGDFAFLTAGKLRQIISRLNGKICLIKGNHDESVSSCSECFEWIKDYYELIVDDEEAYRCKRLIVLLHYPLREWNGSHHGTWHLYGHVHGETEDDEKSLSFDVGVDCHNFYPLSYQDVKDIMSKKKWAPPFNSDR